MSTSHFQLLYALDKAGIKPSDAQILNMRPPEIAAAWGRGDIDATFIWDPVLSTVKKDGKVLMTSGDICKQGACTFDGLVVTRKFAKDNPAFMVALVKAIAKADADYKANPGQVDRRRRDKAKAVAKWSGGKVEDVPGVDEAVRLPDRCRSRRRRHGSAAARTARAAKALTQQANFLKEQGRLQSVAPGLLEVGDDRVGTQGAK